MYEIEAKVAINKRDFDRLRKELQKTAEFEGKSEKKDAYFTDSRSACIRLRINNGKPVFEIKIKEIVNKTECNLEIGWGIKNEKKWNNILRNIGIGSPMRKHKKTEAYRLKGFVIELNHISKLGYFLEIERIVKTKAEIPKARKELVDMFKKLGYSHKDFEKKYYLELLAERK